MTAMVLRKCLIVIFICTLPVFLKQTFGDTAIYPGTTQCDQYLDFSITVAQQYLWIIFIMEIMQQHPRRPIHTVIYDKILYLKIKLCSKLRTKHIL
jgi:hypothetical protein